MCTEVIHHLFTTLSYNLQNPKILCPYAKKLFHPPFRPLLPSFFTPTAGKPLERTANPTINC